MPYRAICFLLLVIAVQALPGPAYARILDQPEGVDPAQYIPRWLEGAATSFDSAHKELSEQRLERARWLFKLSHDFAQKVLSVEPEHATAQVMRAAAMALEGVTLRNQGELTAAFERMLEAVARLRIVRPYDPRYIDFIFTMTYFSMADIRRLQGEESEAAALFEEALTLAKTSLENETLSPDDRNYWREMNAAALFGLQRWEESFAALDQLRQEQPEDLDRISEFVEVATLAGHFSQAVEGVGRYRAAGGEEDEDFVVVLMYGAVGEALLGHGKEAIAFAEDAAGRARALGKHPSWLFFGAARGVGRFEHDLASAAALLIEAFDRESRNGSSERIAQALETFLQEVRGWMERTR